MLRTTLPVSSRNCKEARETWAAEGLHYFSYRATKGHLYANTRRKRTKFPVIWVRVDPKLRRTLLPTPQRIILTIMMNGTTATSLEEHTVVIIWETLQ